MKVAINGFGRIGRQTMRIIQENDVKLEIVAINDLTDAETLAHLFEYDSTYGKFPGTVEVQGDILKIDRHEIKIFSEPDPEQLPWEELGVDLVLECSGHFRTHEKASKHLTAGAKKVIVSAPCKGENGGADATIVMGVNEDIYDAEKHNVLSNASCTTNCMAPVIKTINDNFGIKRGMMTTIHSATNDQRILDLPHSDMRRARSTLQSMIPTTTGATKSVGVVLPELQGKFSGTSVRVPLPTVSLVDLTIEVDNDVTVEQVNKAFEDRAKEIPTILAVEKKPLVSKDFTADCHSAIVDAPSTEVLDGKLVKVMAWYDNEWGYSCRLVDLAEYVAKQG